MSYRIARNFGGQKFGELVIKSILVIKILVNECQDVNVHVHSTVRKSPHDRRNGEVLCGCSGAWLPRVPGYLDSHQWRKDEVCS